MSSNRPTIKDVAREAGVSFKTVSRVINGQPGVSEPVRREVRRAISRLGYVVNYSARSLASGGSTTLGVVMPRITSPHLLHIMFHLGQACEQHGMDLIITTRPAVADVLDMSTFLGNGLVGAAVFVAPRRMRRYVPFVKALQMPTVVTETVFVAEDGQVLDVPVPCVSSDHRSGSQEGVSYLIELGHRRIGMISGENGSQTRLRELGYRDALLTNGLQADEALVVQGDWTAEAGQAAMNQLLDLPEPPTAVFCASDTMALGAIRCAKQRGLRVPDDISVLGFDDIPMASWSDPALSTIQQPVPLMMETTVAMIAQALESGQDLQPRNILLPTRLVCRGTCAEPRA